MINAESGHLLISLDTELAWGHFDLDDDRSRLFATGGEFVRENVDRLLGLFNDFALTGSWAVVGHLFYDRCEECEVCPVLAWEGKHKSFHDIYGTADRKWYGSDIVQKILASPYFQEIGFHGYTHRVFAENTMTVEDARVEAEEWLRVASRWGIEPGAVVFPRNILGHRQLLKELGFVCYRDVEVVPRKWQYFDTDRPLAPLKPLRAYLSTPVAYHPTLDRFGLVVLPASRWIGSDHSFERRIGLDYLFGVRLARVATALEIAAQEKKVIHVYLHPYELQKQSDFDRLCDFLSVAGDLVARGYIRSVGMAQLAREILSDLQSRQDYL